MCGGHSSAAPEGVSRTVRTIGEFIICIHLKVGQWVSWNSPHYTYHFENLLCFNVLNKLFVCFLCQGEIEPCKLEVKKQAPIRRFAAMKELVGKIKNVVFCIHCALT